MTNRNDTPEIAKSLILKATRLCNALTDQGDTEGALRISLALIAYEQAKTEAMAHIANDEIYQATAKLGEITQALQNLDAIAEEVTARQMGGLAADYEQPPS